MDKTAESGNPRKGAFGRIVDYLKDQPVLLFGLGGGMLLIASANEEIRPVTVPLLILLIACMLAWLVIERTRTGSFRFRQRQGSTISRSRIANGDAAGKRRFDFGGKIIDSDIGNVGSRPGRSRRAPRQRGSSWEDSREAD